MSNQSQQEIAAPNKECKPYLPVIFLASMAAVVTLTFTIIAYVNCVNDKIAAYFGFFLLLTAIPIFFFIKLYRKKALKPLLVFGFYFVLLILLTLIMYLINLSNASFMIKGNAILIYIVSACIGVLILVSVYAIYISRKDRNLIASSVFGLITGTAVLLMLFAMFNPHKPTKTGTAPIFENSRLAIWGTSAVAIILLAAVGLVIYFTFIEKKRRSTKYLTYAATFVALSVLCKTMGNAISFIPTLKFTIVYVPWILSGIVLGPAGAIITAGMGDVLGQLIIQNGGMPLPLLWVSNTLWPLFPVLAYKFLPLSKKWDWLKILTGMIVSAFTCTLGLSTIAIANLNGTLFWAEFVNRLPQLIIIGINYFLILSLLPVLNRLKITNLKFFEPIRHSGTT